MNPTAYYKFSVDENNMLTVVWYNSETGDVIVSGSKLITDPDYADTAARAFADDLKQNNLDKFPLDPVEPTEMIMGDEEVVTDEVPAEEVTE